MLQGARSGARLGAIGGWGGIAAGAALGALAGAMLNEMVSDNFPAVGDTGLGDEAANDDDCGKDDGDCEIVQQRLENGKRALSNWTFTGLSLPERVAQRAEYNEQVRELNLLIALHNQNCPKRYRVEPMEPSPSGGKPEY